MVQVGWSDSVTGKHVGSAEVVGYLQEEGNANGNALTHLPIHQGAALFSESVYLCRHTSVTLKNKRTGQLLLQPGSSHKNGCPWP